MVTTLPMFGVLWSMVDATHAHSIVIAEVKRLQQTETGVQHDGNRCHMRMRPQRVGKNSAQHKHNYGRPPPLV